MLSAKQRAYLRSKGMNISPTLQIGKESTTKTVEITLSQQLLARELVKISVLQNCPTSAKEIANDLSRACDCDVVCVVGRKILVFKPSEKKLYEI